MLRSREKYYFEEVLLIVECFCFTELMSRSLEFHRNIIFYHSKSLLSRYICSYLCIIQSNCRIFCPFLINLLNYFQYKGVCETCVYMRMGTNNPCCLGMRIHWWSLCWFELCYSLCLFQWRSLRIFTLDGKGVVTFEIIWLLIIKYNFLEKMWMVWIG